jgi:hypothetical protein
MSPLKALLSSLSTLSLVPSRKEEGAMKNYFKNFLLFEYFIRRRSSGERWAFI